MMTRGETFRVMAVAKALGINVPDEPESAMAWTEVLNENGVDVDEALAVVKAWTERFLSARDIITEVARMKRRMPAQMEADLRSAKARGIATADARELTPQQQQLLAAARERDRMAALPHEEAMLERTVSRSEQAVQRRPAHESAPLIPERPDWLPDDLNDQRSYKD